MDGLHEVIIGVSGTFLGGILGYLIRVVVEHRLAIDRIKENIRITEFNKGAGALRAAFAPSLSNLYLAKTHGSTHEVPNVDKLLKESIIAQSSAIEIFRPFVAKNHRSEYQEAWEKYRYQVWNYGFNANSFNEEVEPYSLYEEMIFDILKFAEME